MRVFFTKLINLDGKEMNTFKHLGTGLVPPEPEIRIISPRLFNMAMAVTSMDKDDDPRFYLKYLKIDPSKKTLTGSNGFALVSISSGLDFSSYYGNKQKLISISQPLPNDCIGAVIYLKKEEIHIARKNLPPLVLKIETTDYKYPDFSYVLDNITDENKTNEDTFCLNPKWLRNMQKALGKNITAVAITPYKSQKGSLFYSIKFLEINEDYKAIVMPCRQ